MLRHHLPYHGRVQQRPLKKQAVRPTKLASVKRLIKQSAEESSLLRLPPEVRELIWKAAVGDRTIHIKHFDKEQIQALVRHQTHPDATNPEGAFRHIECITALTENEAYEKSNAPSSRVPAGENPAYFVQSCKSRHSVCYSTANENSHMADDEVGEERVWISLFEQSDHLLDNDLCCHMCTMLGTCRQIYEEAYRLFWISNTFSFDDPESLSEFVGSLTLSQRRHLTNLHISYSMDGEWLNWYQCGAALKKLSGLRTLHLCIEQHSTSPHYYQRSAQDWDVIAQTMSQPWVVLRTAPLANITVVISDQQSLLEKWNMLDVRCTVLEKSGMAEKIRANLVDQEAMAKARQELSMSRAKQNTESKKQKQRRILRLKANEARRLLQSGAYSITDLDMSQADIVSTAIMDIRASDKNDRLSSVGLMAALAGRGDTQTELQRLLSLRRFFDEHLLLRQKSHFVQPHTVHDLEHFANGFMTPEQQDRRQHAWLPWHQTSSMAGSDAIIPVQQKDQAQQGPDNHMPINHTNTESHVQPSDHPGSHRGAVPAMASLFAYLTTHEVGTSYNVPTNSQGAQRHAPANRVYAQYHPYSRPRYIGNEPFGAEAKRNVACKRVFIPAWMEGFSRRDRPHPCFDCGSLETYFLDPDSDKKYVIPFPFTSADVGVPEEYDGDSSL